MIKNRRTSGQSMIEFVFIFPILIFMVLAFFDLGRFVLFYATLNTAVREGTRYGIVQPYSDTDYDSETCDSPSGANVELCSYINGKLFDIGDLSDAVITVTRLKDLKYLDPDYDPAVNPDYIEEPIIHIAIVYDFDPITPGLGFLGDFTMNVESQMLISPKARQ